MLPSEEKQLEMIEKITKQIKSDWPNHEKRWDLERRGFNYLKSLQHSPEQEDYYTKQNRPMYTFNAIFEKFNYVIGNHFLTDQKQKVYRKAGGTHQVAQLWSDVLDHVHTDNNYRLQLGRTVLEGWINQGFLYPRYTNERQIDGSMVYTNEDGFLVMYDSRARDYFLDDAKYVSRMRYMVPSDIIEEKAWSDRKSKLKELFDEIKKEEYRWDEDSWQLDNYTNPHFQNIKDGKYLIVEHFEIVWDYTDVIIDPFTQEASIIDIKEPKRRNTLIRDAEAEGKQIVERKERIKKVTTFIPALSFMLSHKDCDTQDGMYDIIPYSPYPYGVKTIDNYGMMQIVLGPQDFLNDMHNRTLDIMNQSANVGVEIVPDAYENPNDAIHFGAKPGIKLIKKAEYIGRDTYKRFDPPKLAFDSVKMAEEAKYFIEIASAADEAVGREVEAGVPASRYAQQVAQGQVKLAVPTFCLNMVKTRLNNKLIKLGQSNYNTERLILMRDKETGEDKELRLNIPWGDKILNNVQVGEYEVVIDNAMKSPLNSAVRNAEKMDFIKNILMPLLGPNTAMAIDWDDLLLNSDMGDMKQWLENIKQVVGQAAEAQGEQAALEKINNLMSTAGNVANAGDAPANKAARQPVMSEN